MKKALAGFPVVTNEIQVQEDGDSLEIYVGGWYVCNVLKTNLSKEASYEIGFTEDI